MPIVTSLVLAIVLISKFVEGAWIAIVAMGVLFLLMRGIRKHYDLVRTELYSDVDAETTLPARVHAIVLLSKLHKPAMRALAYARATRPSVLEAVTVSVDAEETQALEAEWERRGLPVPLKVLDSPYREVTRTVIEYIRIDPPRQPARRHHGLHPRIRRRPLVGAPAAQPERAAAEGPAAVHARRDGRERAVAVEVVDRGDRRS